VNQHVVDVTGGTVTVIEVEDVVYPEPDPDQVDPVLASALAKLQALGLTEAEAIALAGG
jgi:hypothetical protein